MNPTPHIVESAFMLLAAFAIGGLLGFILKRLFHRPGPDKPVSETSDGSVSEE